MDFFTKWQKTKKTGHFKRKVRKTYFADLKKNAALDIPCSSKEAVVDGLNSDQANFFEHTDEAFFEETPKSTEFETEENWNIELESDETDEESEYTDSDFRVDLKEWSLIHNIRQNALKSLFNILNKRYSNIVPTDPRTFLNTPKEVMLSNVGTTGQYYHHGFIKCIKNVFPDPTEDMLIQINISLDGLPTYKSSKDEFWPILFNIHKMPDIKPMIIGIYSGKSKPDDLKAFLEPFVQEMKVVLKDGIYIKNHVLKFQIRSFICDSPARAFVKGKNKLGSF